MLNFRSHAPNAIAATGRRAVYIIRPIGFRHWQLSICALGTMDELATFDVSCSAIATESARRIDSAHGHRTDAPARPLEKSVRTTILLRRAVRRVENETTAHQKEKLA